MKSKAPLALMEQMIMVLVFALAAALCLRTFALSDRLSRECELRDGGVLLAQNAAEVCKAGGGDWEYMEFVLGGEALEYGWKAFFDEELTAVAAGADAVYEVVVCPEASEMPGLGRAAVSVYDAEGALLFQLPAAWQEEVRHG